MPSESVPTIIRVNEIHCGNRENRAFDPDRFLATIARQEKPEISPEEKAFHSRRCGDAVSIIQKAECGSPLFRRPQGSHNRHIEPENFFGEARWRPGSANGIRAAMTDCQILRIEKKAMMDALTTNTPSDMFVAYAGPI